MAGSFTPAEIQLARSFALEVSSDGTTWNQLYGLNDFNYVVKATMQDSSDFNSDGWTSQTKTVQGMTVTVKANTWGDGTSSTDPAFVTLKNARTAFGDAGYVQARFWRTDKYSDGGDDWQGKFSVEVTASKTGVPDLYEQQITLTNQGAPTPYTPAPAAPVITAATPSSGAASGSTLTLTGTGFTGATGVTIGGTAGTALSVASDTSLSFTVPTGSAGSSPIVVTGPGGSSNSFAYTRGA